MLLLTTTTTTTTTTPTSTLLWVMYIQGNLVRSVGGYVIAANNWLSQHNQHKPRLSQPMFQVGVESGHELLVDTGDGRGFGLDQKYAQEVVGDGTNGQVGPFETALGEFYTGNVLPVAVGAFSEVNEDASKLITRLARLTAKTDFGNSPEEAAVTTSQTNHIGNRWNQCVDTDNQAGFYNTSGGYGTYEQCRYGNDFCVLPLPDWAHVGCLSMQCNVLYKTTLLVPNNS
ncbi:hypothetical protein THAOC_15684 [Thalassiosira oceanica]|uniref:Uncharacterized protein n=1 Tax=Thalassiosira oceanica TaxID=159749 RepID=K0SRK9_THAOC|nr:hypothetical protein THAOC_15684 [Thalassiosira oceanica]|eukprot:EJK63646.1 hypothetical protein THAOC_15684 [Thalassiosira oceanica]